MAEADLEQRNYVIDGMDGISFVQTKEEGVPVYVNPTLIPNDMAEADMGQRNYVIDGMDGF